MNKDEIEKRIASSLSAYPNINFIISENKLEKYIKSLSQMRKQMEYIENNLFLYNYLFLQQYLIEQKYDNVFKHIPNRLEYLENIIKRMSTQKITYNYRDNIFIQDDIKFLSCLSELSVTYKLMNYYKILDFEADYSRIDTFGNRKNRSIDIKIKSKENNKTINIEIYTPFEEIEEGVLCVDLKNTIKNDRKIDNKIRNKFQSLYDLKLPGDRYLFVNIIFAHQTRVNNYFYNQFDNYKKYLQKNNIRLDGIIVYEDNLEGNNGIKIYEQIQAI